MPQETTSVRAVAGLMLKNNVLKNFSAIPLANMQYVKALCLQSINDREFLVRGAVGIVITTILSLNGIEKWPEALARLMELLDSNDANALDGAFSTLKKICEDSAAELDDQPADRLPLNYMIPKLISFFGHHNPKVRTAALFCVNKFILLRSNALMVNIDAFTQGLFARASDESPEVRQQVCQALVMMLEVRPDTLLPHLPNLVDYMLHSSQDANEDVALEACEFWLAFAEQEEIRYWLQPYIPRIIPVLLKCMVYSETELTTLGADEDDSNVQDNEADIMPRHHKAKTSGMHAHIEKTQESAKSAGNATDDEDEADDDDDDDEFDDLAADWSLRKCSAAALDIFAGFYEKDVLDVLLPLLQTELANENWLHRECAILALGAVAEGCLTGIEPHLPNLVPYLLRVLGDPKPLVRSITCWTLGRYATWCISRMRTRTSILFRSWRGLVFRLKPKRGNDITYV